ncbi:hypothetical protein SRABI70_00383 [Pseudomonas sp. Bi70]|uniref:hypothetical protein n=1 Tax=Pseudomonas sp. Bi70 TaxID=2821127 RepID=UPI001E02D6BF|nr:hypothetical protein [Pseudomonas sp. Bi70]CAH0145046.1 hypothetical protein SRABI70_00383 [Pseudomonas sp. Bi70]
MTKDLDMRLRAINYLLFVVLVAVASSYLTVWFQKGDAQVPTTIPPMIFQYEDTDLLVWGGWKTVAGYAAPGTNAVEIQCRKDRKMCSEAVASVHQHSEGQDLEASTYEYSVTDWTENGIEAIAENGMGSCLDRVLRIGFQPESATVQWRPGAGCEGSEGHAVLIGDPL